MGISLVSYRASIGHFHISASGGVPSHHGSHGKASQASHSVLNGQLSHTVPMILILSLCLMVPFCVGIGNKEMHVYNGNPIFSNCLLLNARSLKSVNTDHNKIAEFHNLACAGDLKLIAVTETWLTTEVQDYEVCRAADWTWNRGMLKF